MIYLDNNATTELLPEVREAILHALDVGPTKAVEIIRNQAVERGITPGKKFAEN
ncbi:MAG: hypothetical protein PHR35_22120 [Kiritimatiellae bacterium]|nr:hypothetical protein [Kiritimatiellia bacterium]